MKKEKLQVLWCISDTTEIQRIIRDKQLYANKMDSLEEMYKFLEKNKLQRLKQKT